MKNKPKAKFSLSILSRYIMSYLLLFALPLCVLGLTMYNEFSKSYEREIKTILFNQLEQTSDIVDRWLLDFRETASIMASDPRLTPYNITNGGYSTIEAIKELKRYRTGCSYAQDIFYYVRGDSSIYSPAGKTTLNTFFALGDSISAKHMERIKYDLNNTTVSKVTNLRLLKSSAQDGGDNIVYLAPVNNSSPKPFATAMVILKQSMLQEQLEKLLGEIDGSAYIINTAESQILAKAGNIEINTETLLTKIAQHNSGKLIDYIDTDTYGKSLLLVNSTDTQLCYITLVPKTIFKNATENSVLVSIILISLSVLGIILAITISYKQYIPLKKLFSYASSAGEPTENSNQFTVLHQFLEEQTRQSTSMKNQIEQQLPILEDIFVAKLMTSEYKSLQDGSIYATVERNIKNHHYQVAVIAFDKNALASPVIKDMIINKIKHLSLDGCTFYCTEIPHNKELCILATISLHLNKSEIADKIKEYISLVLKESVSEGYYISVSTICETLDKIAFSYAQAKANTEKMIFKGYDTNDEPSEIESLTSKGESKYLTLFHKSEMLCQFVKNGNKVAALELYEEFFNSLSNDSLSINTSKLLCYKLVSDVNKLMLESKLSFSNELSDEDLNISSIPDFRIPIKSMIDMICNQRIEKEKEKDDLFISQVLSFIAENYKMDIFSQVTVAEKFNVSSSYLSRFFSEKLGVSFIQYVNDLKMNEAKRLLVTTDIGISNIIEQVGYLDKSNFMKRFKKNEGITMGQYRNLYTK